MKRKRHTEEQIIAILKEHDAATRRSATLRPTDGSGLADRRHNAQEGISRRPTPVAAG